MSTFVLILSCRDVPGIVHAVSEVVWNFGGDIEESQQFGDRETGRFFMRVAFAPGSRTSLEGWRLELSQVAARFGMEWQLYDEAVPTRVLVMVSRGGHCLNDLLYRVRNGTLPVVVPAVVSNHEMLRPLAEFYDVPFFYVPVDSLGKKASESQLRALVADLGIELVVLARYMQVLSDELCKHLDGRAINIHHSFLPSFKGARPYHQAHARGVKLVGATAHYVTADLDEGPIIEQDVVRVEHALTADDLAGAGRDVEAQVLARAVRWHTEHRVLLNGRRTVVFR
jgi:formyltetrahydrofolate deformylase